MAMPVTVAMPVLVPVLVSVAMPLLVPVSVSAGEIMNTDMGAAEGERAAVGPLDGSGMAVGPPASYVAGGGAALALGGCGAGSQPCLRPRALPDSS
ncbi:MAG: hypothetical protein LBW85_10545 [Deltaproteobacteria bacterium]|nr:hypothetical protein [Deltaproteobacteria bacterium]